MKQHSKILRGLAAAVVFGLTAPPATATLLVYEGFDYTVPSTLQYSGTGEIVDNSEDGAISLTNVNSVTRSASWMTGGMADVRAGSLGYTDPNGVSVQTSGGHAEMRNARGFRYNTETFATDGGTIYGSYLWHTPNKNDDGAWEGRFDTRMGDGGLGAWIRVTGTSSNLQLRFGGTTVNTSIAMDEDTTYFVVFKQEYNVDGNMTNFSLWLNPSDLTSEANSTISWNDSIPTVSGGGFGGFALEKSDLSGGEHPSFDEVRIGTTWEAVAIPEPSTLVLLGLAGAAAALLRRRR